MQASDERTYLIALTQLYRNKLRKARQLLAHYGSARVAWEQTNEEGKSRIWELAKREEDFIEKHGITVWCPEDADYPFRLRECVDAPMLLYGKGNISANQGKMVSVVGTRDCTDRGKELARQLVLDLAAKMPDVTIVSGLAYGVDVAAHRAALEADIPTLIIAGHGLDRIYPAIHRNVAVDALRKGGILTEYISQSEPDRIHFVARDRIIAGMADAVVVVESKERGGSLITAQMALDYSRSLFAFPGRVSDLTSRGCNQLIRDNKAMLIESADDLMKGMMWEEEKKNQPLQTEMVDLFEDLTQEERTLLQYLREQEDGVHINSLTMETGIAYSTIASTLMMMEMKGIVKSLPGGIFRALK